MLNRPISPEEVVPNPRLRAFVSKRRNRRVLALTGNLSYLLMLVVLALLETLPLWLSGVAVLALALVGCVHGILLNVGTQLIAASAERHLDERQREVWGLAHYRAYRVLSGVFSAGLLYALVAHASGLWLPSDFLGWLVVGLAFWGLVVTLPSYLVYWTEPDALDEPAEPATSQPFRSAR